MYKLHEIDFFGIPHLLGSFKTLQEARKKEREALKASKGEFSTYIEDGKKCITYNGKIFKG